MKINRLACLAMSLLALQAYAADTDPYQGIDITPDKLSQLPMSADWNLSQYITDWNIANDSGVPLKITINVSPEIMGTAPLILRCADDHNDQSYTLKPGEIISCTIDSSGFAEWGNGFQGLQYAGTVKIAR